MKSKILKTKNVPHENVLVIIRTRPILLFSCVLFCGLILLAINQITQTVGALLCLFALYSLFAVQDRVILEFNEEYIIVYDEFDKTSCKLLYYDEILYWDYIQRARYDKLVIEMIDGSSENISCFGRIKIESVLKIYAPNKRKKRVKGRTKR